MEKERLLTLCNCLLSDNDAERDTAEEVLIRYFAPLFKKWYERIHKYLGMNISYYEYYNPDSGMFIRVVYAQNKNTLSFYYYDEIRSCEDVVEVDINEITNDNFLDREEYEAWRTEVVYHESRLCELKKNQPKEVL